VLVDFANCVRARGEGRFRAILAAGQKRMRPIILTTVPTMDGLVPLAYSFFGQDELLAVLTDGTGAAGRGERAEAGALPGLAPRSA